MKNESCIVFVLPVLLFMAGCRKHDKPVSEDEYRKTREALVGANRIMVKKDTEKILAYINRRGWEMQVTPSGLWYMLDSHGAGKPAKRGNMVVLNYRVELLDGTLCYSSDSLGSKQFRIGQGGVESGLEEGILLLKTGDRARFILPPHLAHGLVGDGNRIPARSIIVYDVYVLEIKE
jgi:FKBP-type peptidyl-prolyl cis-trans isomerase